jgi:hypothetical protein
MVGVPDRRAAPGVAADLVADHEELTTLPGEHAAPRVHRHQLAGPRGGVQASQPDLVGVEHQAPGEGSGEVAVAGEVRRLVAAAQQRALRHHEPDLDGRRGRLARVVLPGHASNEGVGHDLGDRARIALSPQGVGVPAERGVGRDALGDGEQRVEAEHRVRRGARGDSTVGCRLARPSDGGTRVEAVADRLGAVGEGAVGEPREVAGELAIDRRPVLAAQARGLLDHDGRAPLAEVTSGQGRERVGEVLDQRAGDADMLLAQRGRLTASQRDLGRDPTHDVGRGLVRPRRVEA